MVVDSGEIFEYIGAVGAGVAVAWRIAKGIAGGSIGLDTPDVEAVCCVGGATAGDQCLRGLDGRSLRKAYKTKALLMFSQPFQACWAVTTLVRYKKGAMTRIISVSIFAQ